MSFCVNGIKIKSPVGEEEYKSSHPAKIFKSPTFQVQVPCRIRRQPIIRSNFFFCPSAQYPAEISFSQRKYIAKSQFSFNLSVILNFIRCDIMGGICLLRIPQYWFWWLIVVTVKISTDLLCFPQATKARGSPSLHWHVPGCFAVSAWLAECSGAQSFNRDRGHGWSRDCANPDWQSQGATTCHGSKWK